MDSNKNRMKDRGSGAPNLRKKFPKDNDGTIITDQHKTGEYKIKELDKKQ